MGSVLTIKQGNYEYDYDHEAPETNEYTAASDYQNSRSSETPRYAPTHDATYGEPNQAAFGASPVTTPDYTTSTYEDATAALGKLDLNKGKEREAGNLTHYIRRFNMSQLIIGRIRHSGFNVILDCTFSCPRHAYCAGRGH